MSEITSNTFNDGLVSDLAPLNTPNTVMTYCLNGTLLTYNGNENVLLNDMGNVEVKTESDVIAALPEGFVPVGMKESGGIIYVASINPETNICLIGSFPSPQYVYGDNLFEKVFIDFYKSNSRTEKYFIDIVKYQNDVANTIDSLYVSDEITKVLYFKNLWDNLDIDYSLVDRNSSGWYILTFNILTLINQKLLYPLFLTNLELQKLKSGDLLTILSNILLKSSNSNVVDAINSGAISILWMVNTTYSGLYILNNYNIFLNSAVSGIGDSWYYKEPNSTLSLQVQFNVIYPSLSVEKYEDRITYHVKKDDKLLSVLFIDRYGNYIPMEDSSNEYTISIKRKINDNNDFTVSVIPITTYAGLMPLGKVNLLVNNKYIYNEITLWKYKYSNTSADFQLLYTNDAPETLKKLKIELLDLSKLEFSQILTLTELTISSYKTDKEIEFDITLLGVVTGTFNSLLGSHLYLVVVKKTIEGDLGIDIIETVGYRFLYACSIYNNYYNLYNDYNNINSSDLIIVDNTSIPNFSISQGDEPKINTNSKLYYNYDGGWSTSSICLGNWQLEKSDSNVNKKINLYVFDLNIPINTNLDINTTTLSNLLLLYGGVFNKEDILQLFSSSNKDLSVDGGYLIIPQDEVINDLDLYNEIKILDSISGLVSVEYDSSLYIRLHNVSNSYGFTLTNDSVKYHALNRLNGINNVDKDSYKFAVLYYDSRLGYLVPISTNYLSGIINNNTFVNTSPSGSISYENFNKNAFTNNLYIINTYQYLSYDNTITPIYLRFKCNEKELNITDIDGVISGNANNTIYPNKYLICLYSNYLRGSRYLLPIILDGNDYSDKFSISNEINNILTSITSNFYSIQQREELTIKCPYNNDNIVRFNKYNIEILNSNYLSSYIINNYHILDGITSMNNIFECVCKNFNINNINTTILINSIYTGRISLSINNMNNDFLSMSNQCSNKNYEYYTIDTFSTLFSPEVIADEILSTEYIINDDYLVKDHMGNVKGSDKGYLFIPRTSGSLVRKLMKSLINPSIEYLPSLVFLNSTTIIDNTSVINELDNNIATLPTVLANEIDVCYNSYDLGLQWPVLPFKMIDLYIEGLTPITVNNEQD